MTERLDTLLDIMRRWRHVKDAAIESRQLRPDCCILASKVLLVELTDNGFDAWAEPTYAIAVNRAADLHAHLPIPEWPDEAWSVGIEPGKTDSRYPGHLVVMVRYGYPRWEGDNPLILVDGSASQFSRPLKNMTIPSTLTIPAPDWPHAGHKEPGWRIVYRPAPLGDSHRVAPDWTRNWRRHLAEMRAVA